MKFRHVLEYVGARTVLAFFRILPVRIGAQIGSAWGAVAFRVDARHRRLALWNLSKSDADRGPAENRRIVGRLYRHLGMMLAEIAHMHRRDEVNAWTSVEGEEHLRAALAKGRGVIIVVAHFGNWELAGAVCALHVPDVRVVAFPQRNPLVDRMICGIREAAGMKVLLTGAAAKPILRAVKENAVIGILADQDVAERGVFVHLLGRPAATSHGPSVLAHRAEAPVLTAFLTRVGPARHHFQYQAEVPMTGDAVADTQAIADRLSAAVREHPDQWLWLHDRWKTVRRPDGSIARERNPPLDFRE